MTLATEAASSTADKAGTALRRVTVPRPRVEYSQSLGGEHQANITPVVGCRLSNGRKKQIAS